MTFPGFTVVVCCVLNMSTFRVLQVSLVKRQLGAERQFDSKETVPSCGFCHGKVGESCSTQFVFGCFWSCAWLFRGTLKSFRSDPGKAVDVLTENTEASAVWQQKISKHLVLVENLLKNHAFHCLKHSRLAFCHSLSQAKPEPPEMEEAVRTANSKESNQCRRYVPQKACKN